MAINRKETVKKQELLVLTKSLLSAPKVPQLTYYDLDLHHGKNAELGVSTRIGTQ